MTNSDDEPTRTPDDFLRKQQEDWQAEHTRAQESPYAQPGPGQPPQYGQGYGQPPVYGQPPYGQPGYGQPYAIPPAPHPSAQTAMVLGIVSLASLVACGGCLTFLGPFAWVMGAKAKREIDAEPGRYSGRESANAGMIMGIIATVLLILGILVFAVFLIAGFSGAFDDSSSSYDTY